MGYFGWLDGDDSQRSAMLEVVKLFEDSSTIDELGIGSVRDTFSNTFFPGTSTLQTRAKYFLFVPWLVNDVARHRWPVERSMAELRSRETKLIGALLAGGESEGVIGRDAKETLKRMPSELYWASLEHLGIRRWRTSISGYFRNAIQHARGIEDPDLEEVAHGNFGMGALPPVPTDLLSSADFKLDRVEAEFVRARIATTPRSRGRATAARGSLFAWLAVNHPTSKADWVWDHEARDDFPQDLLDLVDDARRVHYTATGPAILYNVMMAEVTGNDEVRDEYAGNLASWAETLGEQEVLAGWDRSAFWGRMLQLNPRIRQSTRQFLDTWWQLADTGRQDGEEARQLVTSRELMLKRTRARLTYPDARSTWGVGAGTGGLDYRWRIARGHLKDVAAGLES